MMSTVVQIALAIQQEEAAWIFTASYGTYFAVRRPPMRAADGFRSNPLRISANFERYYLGSDETKARDDFKNRVAIASAKAVLLIIGAEPKPKGPRHEAETVSPSPGQRRDDSVD